MTQPIVTTVLFARKDSAYKNYKFFDVYDADRDARTYHGNNPVIAHPPCRAWGQLSHLANPRVDEKQLAWYALSQVRLCGGVLEHPKRSRLWKESGILSCEVDAFGGYLIFIDQFHFGHVASKPTGLYICGVPRNKLPPVPVRNGKPWKTICGVVGQPGRRCTQYEREYTPLLLMKWLREVTKLCYLNRKERFG